MILRKIANNFKIKLRSFFILPGDKRRLEVKTFVILLFALLPVEEGLKLNLSVSGKRPKLLLR
jgi:hypothetical protein